MDYPAGHFWKYGFLIMQEMKHRGLKCDFHKFEQWFDYPLETPNEFDLFEGWHNERYLMQCFYNLQEKYDCGGITNDEWKMIEGGMQSLGYKKYNRKYVAALITSER